MKREEHEQEQVLGKNVRWSGKPSEPVDLNSPTANQLISFGDRVTYTFAYGKEVGSIHFDKGRGEIFFKGHNIRNMELEDWQSQKLEEMKKILSQDYKTRNFSSAYGKALEKITHEKVKEKK